MNKMAAVAPNVITGELEVKSQLFAYEAQQDVGGVVTLHIAPGKKIEHLGIKVQFIGRIDMVSVLCIRGATILVWTPSFYYLDKCFVRIWASITVCS